MCGILVLLIPVLTKTLWFDCSIVCACVLSVLCSVMCLLCCLLRLSRVLVVAASRLACCFCFDSLVVVFLFLFIFVSGKDSLVVWCGRPTTSVHPVLLKMVLNNMSANGTTLTCFQTKDIQETTTYTLFIIPSMVNTRRMYKFIQKI